MSPGDEDLRGTLSLDIGPFRRALQTSIKQVQSFSKEFASAFKADTRKSVKGVNDLNDGLKQASNSARQLKMGMLDLERIVGGILLSQAFYGAKNAIEDAGAALFNFMNDIERSQIALEYFLATPQQATAFLQELQTFAAETSFNTVQAVALSRKLLAAQFDPNDVKGVLTILNDASAASGGTAEQLDRIVLAITQIRTNGKIAGQELRQLGEAGIPVYQILQEELGLTGEQVLNVGDLQISGEEGVQAVLRGLEKRYKGAADRLADTVPGLFQTIQDDTLIIGNTLFRGPYEALRDFLTVWRDTFSRARDLVFEGGLGKALEELIPPELHTQLRIIAGSIKSIGSQMKQLFVALVPVAQLVAGGLITALSAILLPLAGLIRLLTQLTVQALNTIPGLKFLVAALATVFIAKGAATAVLFFWRVLRLSAIAKVAGDLVLYFAKAVRIATLALLRNPIVLGITLVTVAVLHLTGALKVAVNWVNTLIERLANLGGFSIDAQLQDTSADNSGIDEYLTKLGQIGSTAADGLEEAKDEAGKADKAFKKFAASFDELYQIPDQSDSGKDKGGDSGLGDLGDLGNIDIPEIKIPPIEVPKIELPPIEVPDIIIGKVLYEPKPPPPPDIDSFLPPTGLAEAWGLEWERVQAAIRERVLQGWLGWQTQLGAVFQGVNNLVDVFGKTGEGAFEGLNRGAQGALGVLQGLERGTATALLAVGQSIIDGFQYGIDGAYNGLAFLGETTVLAFQGILDTTSSLGQTIGAGIVALWQGVESNTTASWLAITAGIGASVVAVGSVISTFTANTALNFKTWAQGVGSTVKGLGSSLLSSTQAGFQNLKTATSTALTGLQTFWTNHGDKVKLIAGIGLTALAVVFTGGLGGILAGAAAWAPRLFAIFRSLGPTIIGFIRTLPDDFLRIINGIVPKLGPAVMNIANAFKQLPTLIFNLIKSIPDKFVEVFKNIKIPSFSEIGGAIKTTFTNLVVPGYATGGIITQDHLARVGEGNKREAIIPLENYSAMAPFADAVAARLRGGDNSNSQPQPGTPSNQEPTELHLHVGTLVADERGLRQLHAMLQTVSEEQKGAKR